MHTILVMGAGKIGSLTAFLLAHSKDYHVYLADLHLPQIKKMPHLETVQLDIRDTPKATAFLRDHSIEAIVSCLPYYCNSTAIQLAHTLQRHYFDLTEDVETARLAKESSKNKTAAIVPQCGIAPGFISIATHELAKDFSEIDSINMRVGALPQQANNSLQYALTWSTDGLINEYSNPCETIHQGQLTTRLALEDMETIKIDGLTYEAFNTSGGVGTLVHRYLGKVKEMNYKTIRYPGHGEKMRFLMQDLKLNEDRTTLKNILEKALPETLQDVVLVSVSVTGKKDQHYFEKNYVRKFYPKEINGIPWSAIQLTTASALCAVIDIVMQHPEKYQGFIQQEQFSLADITQNRFGNYYV